MTDYVTSKDGTKIAYDKVGQGPPLLLVGGAMSVRSLSFAQKMADGLAEEFTVLHYDRRGRGDSGDTQPYSVTKEVEDLAALAKAAGGKPYVVGLSSGACLALEAAAAGVPMAGLVAYEPPYVKADPTAKADDDYQEKMDALIAKGDRAGAVTFFMRTVGVPGPMLFVMKLLPMWKTMLAVAHTLPYDARCVERFHVPAKRFAAIRVPAVVANGAKTPDSLKAAAVAAAKAVPKARHEVVPKASHAIAPAALCALLVKTFKSDA